MHTNRMDHQSQHEGLVAACMQGSRKAQSELYSLYSQAMYNTILRMVSNRADAEDLLQSAFVEVFMKMDSFRNESTIGAWIKRIVVNKTINFLKTNRLKWSELEDKHEKVPIVESDYEAEQKANYTVQKVKEAVNELLTDIALSLISTLSKVLTMKK